MKHRFLKTKFVWALSLLGIVTITGILLAQSPRRPWGMRWDTVATNTDVCGRYAHGAVVYLDRLWVFGGLDEEGFLNDVWWSTNGENWALVTSLANWSPRSHFATVAFRDQIWIFGGHDGTTLNDVWRSEDGRDWELVRESAPWAPRSSHTAIVYEDAIYLMGGHGKHERFNDVWKSTDGISWEQLTDNAPWEARSHHAVEVHDGQLILAGGATYDFDERDDYRLFNDIWVSEDGATWTQITDSAPWTPRAFLELVSVGEYLLLLGGMDQLVGAPENRDFWRSRDGQTWELQTDEGGFRHRYAHTILFHNDNLWAIAGYNPRGGFMSPVRNVRRISLTGMPR